ncbi:protein NOI4 [Citrus sinensis]|uniref:Protein NOI4 n=1 Tax=Citrus sinensis TaxID=2711 RepID=A0ACB8LTA4_CITSI|nr:protein NOI4 [Citrus sinensis]
MKTQDRGRPLPKFGEWDVNNPASAEGFTVIFNKARDEKKTNRSSVGKSNTPRSDSVYKESESFQYPRARKSKWLCCG